MKIVAAIAALVLFVLTPPLHGEDSPLSISRPWARATPPGAQTGAVYMGIANSGARELAIMQVSTPRAGSAEIHRSTMREGMMTMAPVNGLIVPAEGEIELTPGGLHIMLMGLDSPLVAGDTFPLTLTTMGAGAVTVDVEVVAPGATHDH